MVLERAKFVSVNKGIKAPSMPETGHLYLNAKSLEKGLGCFEIFGFRGVFQTLCCIRWP